MNKKILALALAIVFIATAFTACKRGPELTEINGMELPLAEDKDGNTIINEDNQIAVLVTDRNNEVLTYENGENQTHWAQISGPLVIEDSVRTKEYILAAPKGWEANANGRVIKKDTNENCYIHVIQNTTVSKYGDFESYLATIDSQNDEVTAVMEADGYKIESQSQVAIITSESITCEVRKYKITDSSGKLTHYAENYYFVSGDNIYSVNYVCAEGEGYDSSFNFGQYLSEGFTFKGEK